MPVQLRGRPTVPTAGIATRFTGNSDVVGVLALPQTFFLKSRHQIVRHIAGQVTAKELAAWAAQLP